MRKKIYTNLFAKQFKKLRGKQLETVFKKIAEIRSCQEITHYKFLRYQSNKLQRVHVNKSFIIVFYEENETIYFVDYDHHDNVYKRYKYK